MSDVWQSLVTIAAAFWSTLGEMAPYLLLGFLVAGLLSVFVRAELVERHLGGRGLWQVVKASLFGVPLPLCSCGVVPVAASLRRHGAGRGATVAFLISTPQTGVDSIFVTLSLLGPVYAVYRPIAALVSGVVGGALADLAGGRAGAAADAAGAHAKCTGACCAPSSNGRLRRALAYGFGDLPQDIGRALLIGLVIAALITAFVPPEGLGRWLGGGVLAMLLMMALGIPVYVCATASVPIAAALIAKGASPGAALVFLMTGPATNAATIATVWKVMGPRTAAAYLLSVAATALGAGLLLDAVYTYTGAVAGEAPRWELPAAVKWAAAVALLAVLAVGAIRSRRGHVERPHAAPCH